VAYFTTCFSWRLQDMMAVQNSGPEGCAAAVEEGSGCGMLRATEATNISNLNAELVH
jgi:hypothetical protein